MSCILLYQSGTHCFDPKSRQMYDPWTNHIWKSIEQIRIWNPNIPIYFLCDVSIEGIPCNENFARYSVNHVHTDTLEPEEVHQKLSGYFSDPNHQTTSNPLWRTSLMRFFFIEKLMCKMRLANVITFDNDVMVYTDLNHVSEVCANRYPHIAITKMNENELVCGMMWIPDLNSMSVLNKMLLSLAENPQNATTSEMVLLNSVRQETTDLISILPIWFMGSDSENNDAFGGIFDPGTLGQYMVGCHNGSPPGTIMMHHSLGIRLNTRNYSIVARSDEGRKYFCVKDKRNETCVKINSIHVHNKKMEGLMSNA